MLPVCVFETIKLFLVTEVQLRHGAETPIPRASSGNSVFFAGKKRMSRIRWQEQKIGSVKPIFIPTLFDTNWIKVVSISNVTAEAFYEHRDLESDSPSASKNHVLEAARKVFTAGWSSLRGPLNSVHGQERQVFHHILFFCKIRRLKNNIYTS